MTYRLLSQRDPTKIIELKRWAWFGLLDLAEQNGWNPMGTVLEHSYRTQEKALDLENSYDGSGWNGGYTEGGMHLVIIEDALNLGDALDRAFLQLEPTRSLNKDNDLFAGIFGAERSPVPGIGVIEAVADLCMNGAFYITYREDFEPIFWENYPDI